MIADCFGPERINEYLGKHKLDLVLVYGAEPWSLSECGRSNARFVSKATFEALALHDTDGRSFNPTPHDEFTHIVSFYLKYFK